MNKLSLTTFVDIVSSSGIPKSTKTRNALKAEEDHPTRDYYRQVRQRIIELHEGGHSPEYLRDVMNSLNNENKRTHYSEIVSQYMKWLGNKKPKWFSPPYALYERGNVSIRVNPELGLKLNGKKHSIKLYFKSDPLSKAKADIIMGLMNLSLEKNHVMAVLDIRQMKMYKPTKEIPMLQQTVDAEIAYISQFLEG